MCVFSQRRMNAIGIGSMINPFPVLHLERVRLICAADRESQRIVIAEAQKSVGHNDMRRVYSTIDGVLHNHVPAKSTSLLFVKQMTNYEHDNL